jgi:hypothetical protein
VIIYFKGFIDLQRFEQAARDNSLEPNKVIFLFPGNSSHHGPSISLFSIKSGGGLGRPAAALGASGYPVLSLPTTSMERWSSDKGQQHIVETAIADLYRAAGAGYSFMLPIRDHRNQRYFDDGLRDSGGVVEPSFWGENATTPNKPLAKHYTKVLNDFHDFIALPDHEKLEKARLDLSNVFYAAYLTGLSMTPGDHWLALPRHIKSTTPLRRSEPPKFVSGAIVSRPKQPEIEVSKKPVSLPDSSRDLDNRGHRSFVQRARAVLDDYTKGDSAVRRFFSGHWNRHHVKDVAAIVRDIDRETLNSRESILKRLRDIQLVNKEGSLATRLRFLESMHGEPGLQSEELSSKRTGPK